MTGLAIRNARTQCHPEHTHATPSGTHATQCHPEHTHAMPFGTQCQYMYSTNGWESFDHKKTVIAWHIQRHLSLFGSARSFPVAQTSIWADSRGALSRLKKGIEPTQKGHWACSIGALRKGSGLASGRGGHGRRRRADSGSWMKREYMAKCASKCKYDNFIS